MTKVFRYTGFHQAKIDAPIEDVWALVTNWGSLAWFDDGTNPDGMKLMDSWLDGEHGVVPRTRVMSRGEGAIENDAPDHNREVLFVEDAVAHRLFYDASDGFVPGIRNYIASWCFDEEEDGGCLMTISANFDCIPFESGQAYGEMLHGVYVSIGKSLQKYFVSKRAA